MGAHPIFESDFDCLTEMSQEPGKSEESRKRKRERDPNQIRVNTSNSQVKWWMVKVPKYLGEKWLSSPQSEVGKLQIRRLGARPEVTFKLNQNLAAMGENQAPIDHKLMLSVPSKSETLGILSRFTNDEDVEVRSIEGSIVQNAVCRPVAMGSRYNNLKGDLFKLFEKHQYYSLKDLGEITKQPIGFLKDVLKEIAVYNTKSTQRNMWELKPEYRDY